MPMFFFSSIKLSWFMWTSCIILGKFKHFGQARTFRLFGGAIFSRIQSQYSLWCLGFAALGTGQSNPAFWIIGDVRTTGRPIFNAYLWVCLGTRILERIGLAKIHLFKIERLLLFNRVWPRVSVSAWLDGWTVRWGFWSHGWVYFDGQLLGGYYIGTLVRYEQIVRVHQKFTVPYIYPSAIGLFDKP